MDCRKSTNARFCNCTYPGCEKHGICCECLRYHLGMRQLPACCFPKEVERTYDRSFERFAELVTAGKVCARRRQCSGRLAPADAGV